MIICEVLASDEDGGLENHFVDMVNSLSRQHRVHVIAHPRYRNRVSPQVVYHPLDMSRSRRNPLLLWRLATAVRNIAPNVLHAHANKAAAMISTLRRFIPCPCVATVHSVKKNISMYDRFDHLIAVSEEVGAKFPGRDCSVIYNGRRLADYASQGQLSAQPPSQPSAVLMITRLVEVKRVDVALAAIASTPDVELWIAGEGDLQGELQLQAQQLGVDDRVSFLGFRDDIPSLIHRASAVLITSDREGFPLALVEALLAQTPVISTAVAGAKEFIPAAYLAAPGDSEGIASVLRYTLQNPSQVQRDFEPVWKRAREQLNFDQQLLLTEQCLVGAVGV